MCKKQRFGYDAKAVFYPGTVFYKYVVVYVDNI